MFSYQTETLPNGVRMLTESIDSVRSAALGIWVATGSRDERSSESGAAHFIEHMLFKGTHTDTAAQLAAGWTPSAASSTPLPPRSAPASTSTPWTAT